MTVKFGAGPFGKTIYSAGTAFDISGTMTVNVGFDAALNNAFACSGMMPATVGFEAVLNEMAAASGTLPTYVGLTVIDAEVIVGPLWNPGQPCADQWMQSPGCPSPGWVVDPDEPANPWGVLEPCNG